MMDTIPPMAALTTPPISGPPRASGAAFDRHIPLERTFNTRDCGGYPAADGMFTRWRTLLRTDCPLTLTNASLASLRAIGVKTAIDLRNRQEIRDDATRHALDRAPGIRYLNLPLIPRFSPEMMPRDLAEAYLMYLRDLQPQIRAVMSALAGSEAPTLVNCQAGKDRTGMIIALALGAVGVPLETLVADYALTEIYVRDLIPELIAEAIADGYDSERYRRMLETPPEAMRQALTWAIQRYGSIPEYLTAIGVTQAELDALRALLLVEHTRVSFGWRLPDERRARTVFNAEVHVYEHSLDRWLMRLLTPTEPVDESLPGEFRALIGTLTGKWVRIPGEARKGLTLPMKYETLRGEIAYFHAKRPATAA
jgi:protein-tyrosine phosphatase